MKSYKVVMPDPPGRWVIETTIVAGGPAVRHHKLDTPLFNKIAERADRRGPDGEIKTLAERLLLLAA